MNKCIKNQRIEKVLKEIKKVLDENHAGFTAQNLDISVEVNGRFYTVFFDDISVLYRSQTMCGTVVERTDVVIQ